MIHKIGEERTRTDELAGQHGRSVATFPGPSPDDAFEPRWLAVALPGLLADKRSDRDIELGIDVSGDVMSLHVDEHGPRVDLHPAERPSTVVQTSPALILGIAAGLLDIDDVAGELEVDGNMDLVGDVLSTPSK